MTAVRKGQSISTLNIVVLVLVLLAVISIALFLYQDRQSVENFPRRPKCDIERFGTYMYVLGKIINRCQFEAFKTYLYTCPTALAASILHRSTSVDKLSRCKDRGHHTLSDLDNNKEMLQNLATRSAKQRVFDTMIKRLTKQRAEKRKSSVPLIVAWTDFFSGSLKESLLPTLDGCEYQCEFVDRNELKLYSNNVSAYILHAPNIEISDLPPQNVQQLIVMYVLESPYHTGSQLRKLPRDYFNATISYRHDSRYFYPYGQFVPLTAEDEYSSSVMTEDELLNSVERRTRGSLIFVSNCDTPSRREEVIRELGAHTEITVRGLCESQLLAYDQLGSSACQTNCSDDDLIATHRFYISFENSLCDEYITEKFFWRASQMLVPVVMKRKIYEGSNIPNGSFIAVDDFENLESLGNYLNYLRINDTEYLQYFEWTKHFRKPDAYKSDAVCKLCRDIYAGETITMDDVEKYYDKRECHYSKSSSVTASEYCLLSALYIAYLSYRVSYMLF